MKILSLVVLSFFASGVHANASPNSAFKAFLDSKIANKSVRVVLCKLNDESIVKDADVLELQQKILALLPQLGIPALKNMEGIDASVLEIRGSSWCSDDPSSFGVTAPNRFSISSSINRENGHESYQVEIFNLSNNAEVSNLYRTTAQAVQNGLDANATAALFKSITEKLVPLSAAPTNVKLENINGVHSISLSFSGDAVPGQLFGIELMENGTAMFMNQLNVTLGK